MQSNLMPSDPETATRPRTPADVYDEVFVPALFNQFGPLVCALASVSPGDAVLDVACGTGACTLAAVAAAGPTGRVIGLDANPEMLAVARRKPAAVDWRDGRAEDLPFEAGRFDAIVSQFGLMFFTDPAAALSEMMRVLKPGGRLAVAVCDAVERSPGYGAFAALLERLFGAGIADAFRAPFVLGDEERLRALCAEAGIDRPEIVRIEGTVRFASVDALVATERACVWTLGGLLDDAGFDALRSQAATDLAPFAAVDGTVGFTMPALVITASKPG